MSGINMKTKTQVTVLVPNYPGAMCALIDRVGKIASFYLPESERGTYGPLRVVFDTEEEADAFIRELGDFYALKKSGLSIGADEVSEVLRRFREQNINIHHLSKQDGEYRVYLASEQTGGLIV